jgi:hypothetical protein
VQRAKGNGAEKKEQDKIAGSNEQIIWSESSKERETGGQRQKRRTKIKGPKSKNT